MSLPAIQKPVLLLDEEKLRANLVRMAKRAKAQHVRLRPHFKTHQSAIIGEWFRDDGVDAITVSSVDMACYFAAHGWQDITIAFPANILESDRLRKLAERINLNLVIESEATVTALAAAGLQANCWVKIDAGYGRTGLHWQQSEAICQLARALETASKLEFAGLLAHFGNTYAAGSSEGVNQVFASSLDHLQHAADHVARQIGRSPALSIGDTPGCALASSFGNASEIRPGNYVFFDVMQVELGSCREEDVAIALAAPVVAIHPERETVIVHGGAVHLSKDSVIGADGRKSYGRVARLTPEGWSASLPDACVTGLSQEHGSIHMPAALCRQLKPGDVLAILPVHSCLTANLMRQYMTLDGQVLPMADYLQLPSLT